MVENQNHEVKMKPKEKNKHAHFGLASLTRMQDQNESHCFGQMTVQILANYALNSFSTAFNA